MQSNFRAYKTRMATTLDVFIDDAARAGTAMQLADNAYDSLMSAFAILVSSEAAAAKERYDKAVATFNRALMLAIGILAAACALSILISLAMTRRILGPLGQAVRVTKQVAAGDLTARIDVHSADETGQLSESLQHMNASLASIVADVRTSAHAVAISAAEISTGNDQLSQRTSTQAANLEETAASLEQLSATVTNNADNTKEANELASGAARLAVKGGEITVQAVAAMNGITENSRRIADIIRVMEGISFQINLLALNAAIYAARAGTGGRAFAVVASEVRSLALRSAESAKQIKSLINESVTTIEGGAMLVNEVGRTMQEIVESFQKVSSLVANIAATLLRHLLRPGERRCW